MDAMADARVRVVISIPITLWKRARYQALIGPAVAVLFATEQLWLVPPWKCMSRCSKKTGGVTTCQEIHKQGYLDYRELYILKSNIPPPPFRFISVLEVGAREIPAGAPPHGTLAKGPQIRRRYTAIHPRTPFPKKKSVGEDALSTTQQRLSARCCEYQKKSLQHKHKIYKLIRVQVNK